MEKPARIVMRADGLILGKSFGNLLKPNTIYQIQETFFGEITFREVGPSEIGEPDGKHPHNWGHSVNEIVQNGCHLYTQEEYALVCKKAEETDDESQG